MQTAPLKTFVQNVLGCGCPAEVFEQIAVSRQSLVTPRGTVAYDRILIGGRLLIYALDGVLDTFADAALSAVLTGLLTAGLAERNANAYNRFRLWLDPVKEIEDYTKCVRPYWKYLLSLFCDRPYWKYLSFCNSLFAHFTRPNYLIYLKIKNLENCF